MVQLRYLDLLVTVEELHKTNKEVLAKIEPGNSIKQNAVSMHPCQVNLVWSEFHPDVVFPEFYPLSGTDVNICTEFHPLCLV